jgi:hypothetical protein
MRATFSISLIVLMLIAPCIRGQEIEKLLPEISDLKGWKMTAKPEVFVGDNLFSLIDGGADLYLEYGFDRVISAHYADPSQNSIQVEIYKMLDSDAAYGIFSISQQAVEWSKQYGNLSAIKDEYISFWKSEYYVILSWSSRQHLDKPLLEKLANLILEKIPEDVESPELVRTFQDIDPLNKIIFLKGNLGLSNFYYFDYKDLFKIQEAIAISFISHNAIIVKYNDLAKSAEMLALAKQGISGNKRFTDVTMAFQGFSCRDNKGNLILIRQIEKYLVILVALDENTDMVPVMDEITQKIENSVR